MGLWADALVWLALGAVEGWIISGMTSARLGEALMALVGILGALLGGLALSLLAPALFTGMYFTPVSLLAALVGGLMFLLIARVVTGRDRREHGG